MLSSSAAFFYGCIGGGIAFVVIMVLPELRQIWEARSFTNLSFSWQAVFVIFAMALVQVLIGGIAAFWMEDADTARQAITYGIAGETLFGGILRAATRG